MPAADDITMGECALDTLSEMTHGPMVQRQIEDAQFMAVRPIIKSDSGVEFEIKNPEAFLELNKTEVEVKLRIKKADGTNLVAGDNVGLINYPVATLFSNVEIKLNQKTITHGSSNYAERAIMEVLMTYGQDAEKSWLQAGLFFKDTADLMDVADPTLADDAVNDGLKTRAEFTALSKLVTVRGKLHEDIFNQPRPLPNNCNLYIRFTRNKDAYCLMSSVANAAYTIDIEEMTLYVKKIKVSDTVQRSIAAKPIVIPVTRIVQKEFNVQSGGNTYVENAFHSGQLPTRLVFALVSSTAHVGSYAQNPFNFVHANVQKVTLLKDGQPVDGRSLSVDFANGNVMDGFWSLARATNTRYANAGTMIELDEYKGGYALWAYDLSPTQCDEEFVDPKRRGQLTLELEFSQNLAAPLILCAYFQFDNEIGINESGQTLIYFD